MDFKVNREIFSTKEVVYDGSNEQSIELDYILPDYFAEVFKVIKCQLSPRVVSHSISGEKLAYELVVGIKVLYLSENSNALRSVEQKMNFSKSINLGKQVDKPEIIIQPKTEYINCRVVNQRRLDFRGAVSIKAKVISENKQQIVSDAFGGNIQLKRKSVVYPTHRLTATKRATIIEELDMGAVKPSIISIVRSEAEIVNNDKKIITNKVITKGEAVVNMLYTCEKENHNSLETMQFNIPFSQIVDVDGINEKHEANIRMNVISCEIIPKGASGESTQVECEINLEISCVANRYDNVDIISDVYSTAYQVKLDYMDAKLEKKPMPIEATNNAKSNLEYHEGDICCVYDAWAKVNKIMSRFEPSTGNLKISGSCNFYVIAKNENSKPVYIENEIPFENTIKLENVSEDCFAELNAMVVSCSYNLHSTNSVELKAEIKMNGLIYDVINNKLITNIEVDENKIKEQENNVALKLYFADEGEDVWEIAKKYNTSIKAIMDENDLLEDTVAKKGMLLIPFIK